MIRVADYKDSLLSSYDYKLDQSYIAQEPAYPRHKSRLLIVPGDGQKAPRHTTVWNWQDELQPGDLIIINNTKVIKARLKVTRPGGGKGELLLLEPRGEGKWLCLAKPGKRMRPGDSLFLEAKEQKTIYLKVLADDQITGGRLIEFPTYFCNIENMQELLEIFGEVPLPPYIKRHDRENEKKYQTSYALKPGAIAAPTAGLHLSNELLLALSNKGIEKAEITLHIGLGTFKPLENESLNDLTLHSEWVEISKEVVEAICRCRARGGRIIAVGTTSVRAIEGAIQALKGELSPFKGMVNLVIKPGYRFKLIDGLLTNLHLPKSSLLLLVSALIGREKLLNLYKEAINLDYRFFSYGDAMWISPEVVLKEAKCFGDQGC